MNWIFLILAGLLEIGFTTSMKLSNGFSNLKWVACFIICIILSFLLINKATETIPLGTAYAIWTGIGAAGTVIVGAFFFNEPLSFIRIFFISTLIASVIGLKIFA
ncbi:DMT family transporter [Pedobacter sp. AW31-3R]|uniref:DMT family transporter n=1 Tax=Pedobacter sp. AW31-3R TaxID=3445781 RepID=UPI003FA06006